MKTLSRREQVILGITSVILVTVLSLVAEGTRPIGGDARIDEAGRRWALWHRSGPRCLHHVRHGPAVRRRLGDPFLAGLLLTLGAFLLQRSLNRPL
jgi:hypothetical protein